MAGVPDFSGPGPWSLPVGGYVVEELDLSYPAVLVARDPRSRRQLKVQLNLPFAFRDETGAHAGDRPRRPPARRARPDTAWSTSDPRELMPLLSPVAHAHGRRHRLRHRVADVGAPDRDLERTKRHRVGERRRRMGGHRTGLLHRRRVRPSPPSGRESCGNSEGPDRASPRTREPGPVAEPVGGCGRVPLWRAAPAPSSEEGWIRSLPGGVRRSSAVPISAVGPRSPEAAPRHTPTMHAPAANQATATIVTVTSTAYYPLLQTQRRATGNPGQRRSFPGRRVRRRDGTCARAPAASGPRGLES